jgi:hypothetical protein
MGEVLGDALGELLGDVLGPLDSAALGDPVGASVGSPERFFENEELGTSLGGIVDSEENVGSKHNNGD